MTEIYRLENRIGAAGIKKILKEFADSGFVSERTECAIEWALAELEIKDRRIAELEAEVSEVAS